MQARIIMGGILLLWNYLRLGATLWYIFYPFVIPLIILYTLRGKKHLIHINWSRGVCEFFRLTIHKVGEESPATEGRVMYLFNHRSMADIFLHDHILDGQASFLSRYLVGVLFVTALLFGDSVWFFRRGVRRNMDQFYNWLDGKFAKSHRPHLLVYPEGHRMQTSLTPAPLKHGMLKYAFSRKIPVQIGISFGNERACCENPPVVNRNGTDIYYSMDQPIHPSSFASEQEFVKEVETRFAGKFVQTLQIYQKMTA